MQDPLLGFDKGVEVNAAELTLKIGHENLIVLDSATLIDVTSRAKTNAFFQPAAWSFHIKSERKYINEEKYLVADIGYSRGKSISLYDTDISFFVGANLNLNNHYDNGAAIEPLLKLDIYRQFYDITYGAFVQKSAYLGHSDAVMNKAGFITSLALSPNNCVVMSAQYNAIKNRNDRELSIGLFHYF